jgi:hypothetical protein
MVMGQSEMEYLFNTDVFYRAITQPTPGDGNLIVVTQSGNNAAPVRTVVNSTTVAAGQVNPAMAALSAFLAYVEPNKTFVVGDGAVEGTSRYDLSDDSTDGSDSRIWNDFASVASNIATNEGSVQNLIECWYNADAGQVNNFRANFWPFYFGANADGSNFVLGGIVNSRRVDRCLWDASASPSSSGRGIFARTATRWHILTPMPFLDGPVSPTAEMASFSENNARLSEPSRQIMHDLASNALAQSVNCIVGPSAHVCRFGGPTSTEIHPDVATADGQVLLVWPIAVALLRAAGRTITEPTVVAVEGPSDGSYADLVVDLPNGGNLTTLRTLRSGSYSGSAPHRQAVTGIEVARSGGARRPVYRTTETSYPADHRGTVSIVDAGSGTPRRGRVRVTPTTTFAFNDSLSYLRGQATAALQEPRDFDLYPDFLIEHIPSLYDASALYPFEGIAVRPKQDDIAVAVPAPSFTARGALFDSSSYLESQSLSVTTGSQGLVSTWFRQTGTWGATRTLFEFRQGSTIVCNAVSASSGRITFRLNNDTATDTWTTPTSSFVGDTWYHLLWAWDLANDRFQVYLNNVAQSTTAYPITTLNSFDISSANVTRFSLAAASGGSNRWTGDIGHFWADLTSTLDLSVQANRERFALAGQPVSVGSNGQTPTGSTPEWYYDGDPPAWSNLGTVGQVTLTGTIQDSTTAPSY